jgi:hypothetical protein
MSKTILSISHAYAEAWVAFEEQEGFDYYYGGTRMVEPSTDETEVLGILCRLMSEESAFKNKLINIALKNGILSGYSHRIPAGFRGSKVGGARCIIKPRDERIFHILQDPQHADFESIISQIFEGIGDLLNGQGGVVKLTPDFGRFAGLADILARFTPHVLGIRCEDGGCGGKSSYAVTGILTALEMLGVLDYQGKAVTLIGSAGALGRDMTKYFLSHGFEDVAVCDLAYDSHHADAPAQVRTLPAQYKVLTNKCLERGGIIVATTFGGELANSECQVIPPGSLLVLAHNLSIPQGETGISLMREIAAREIIAIPGQLLTFGGALTSRLEWFWRQSNADQPFDKELAHIIVREVMSFILTETEKLRASLSVTSYEALLHFAQERAPS